MYKEVYSVYNNPDKCSVEKGRKQGVGRECFPENQSEKEERGGKGIGIGGEWAIWPQRV